MKPFILLVTLAIGSSEWARSDTLHVPGDHATIQSAIESAAEGDRILVAAGTYFERLVMKPHLTLCSDGDDTKGDTGLLRAKRTIIDGGGASGGEAPGVTMAEGSVIDGFTVTNVGAFDDKLWKRHWHERGAKQAHARIGGFAAPAIGADGISCWIRNCIVHHNGDTGIALRGQKKAFVHAIVTANICFRNMGGGIGIMDGAGGVVQGNRCYENFYAGIGHSTGAVPLVTGNTCYENVRAGIGVSEGSSPIVRSNECYGNRRAGIGIRTGAETRPVIEGNHCHENGMAGIGIEEEAEPIVRHNRCEKNRMAGIGAESGARALLVSNECLGNADAGIGMRARCEGILWRNVCQANGKVAIGLPEDGQAIIVENKLSREGGIPPLVAIRGGSRAILAGNDLSGGGVAAILLEGEAILAENTLRPAGGKAGLGIWLWKGSTALGTENRVNGFKSPLKLADGAEWIGTKP